MELGRSLRRFRKDFKLTQREAAAAAGIVPEAYQKYEYEKNVPLTTVLVKIANFYNVSLDYLVGRTDNPAINH